MDRRTFIKLSSTTMIGTLLACRIDDRKSKYFQFSYQQTNYLRPPGSVSEEKFLGLCVNCIACAESCPRGCITFFTGDMEENVIANTPYIVAADIACDLCLKCTTICPTGAILPVEKMEDVKMGKAILIENLCFPYINQGGCGACYTICPVNAVKLDEQRYPKVIDDKCVGCGLCEEICLQKVKAIRIKKS